jgi:syntaxin 16
MGAGGGDVAIDIPDGRGGRGASLPPAWVDFSEEASGDIARIKEKIKALGAAHAKALLPTFDEMGGADDHVVEAVTQDATRLFKRCEGRLQRLSAPGVCTTREDAAVVKNVQRKLAVELQALSMEFRKMQRSYLARLKSQQDRGPGARGVDDVFGLVDAAGGSGSGGGGGGAHESAQDHDVGFTDVQLQRVDRSEAMSFERDQEVMKILESVNDLSNVMKDLSVLIIDQGSILDRIDYNCEQVAMTVDEGRKQLIKAETHQKNSRMIICIYFLMVMCGIMTLVVVFQKM